LATPVTVAVSVKLLPTLTVGVAPPGPAGGETRVAMVGAAWRTVVMSAPLPEPGVPSWWTPLAEAYCTVRMPGTAGLASMEGERSTEMVNWIRHVSVALPGGPSTMALAGWNDSCPVVALTWVMVKTWPAQAVPASPTPVGLTAKTPGSAAATGQSPTPAKEPHEGVRVTLVRVTVPTAWVPSETFLMVTVAGRPVWPTVTTSGNSGGDAEAHAGVGRTDGDEGGGDAHHHRDQGGKCARSGPAGTRAGTSRR
jgi:hypothetical protein